MATSNKITNPYINLVAGTTQATLVTIVGYPFDTMKVKMQASGQNTWSTIKHITRTEGLKGFYKGATMPWLSHLVKRPIQYPLSEWMKTRDELNFMGAGKNFFIGWSSGFLGPIFGTPLQVMKIRAQLNNEKKISFGKLSKEIYKESGLKGFYRGIGPTFMKDSLFGASFIGFYYTLRDTIGTGMYKYNINEKYYVPIPKDFISGATAHCLTWVSLIPIDFVKTKVQKSKIPVTALDVIKKNYARHGLSVFWKGILPATLRTIPVSGIAMTGYEFVRKELIELERRQ